MALKGKEIEKSVIENNHKEETVLRVNLMENQGFDPTQSPSWFQYFQGTDGGTWTTKVLVSNFLQQQFKGLWVDKVIFNYQGEEFGEWDHISLGEHNRYNFKDNRFE